MVLDETYSYIALSDWLCWDAGLGEENGNAVAEAVWELLNDSERVVLGFPEDASGPAGDDRLAAWQHVRELAAGIVGRDVSAMPAVH